MVAPLTTQTPLFAAITRKAISYPLKPLRIYFLILLGATACHRGWAIPTSSTPVATEPSLEQQLETAQKAGDSRAQLLLSQQSAEEVLEHHGAALRREALERGDFVGSLTALRVLTLLAEERAKAFPEPQTSNEERLALKGPRLVGQHNADEVIELLSFGAKCLQAESMIALELLYFRGVHTDQSINTISQYDPRIRSVWMDLAKEDVPRGLWMAGRIYLGGVGVPQDVEKGTALLRAAGLVDAHMELGLFAYQSGDLAEAEKEWLFAGQAFEHAEGWYSAAIVAREQKQMETAVFRFQQALSVSPGDPATKIELGRHLMLGLGTPVNKAEARKHFEDVLAMEQIDPDLRAMAGHNLEVLRQDPAATE